MDNLFIWLVYWLIMETLIVVSCGNTIYGWLWTMHHHPRDIILIISLVCWMIFIYNYWCYMLYLICVIYYLCALEIFEMLGTLDSIDLLWGLFGDESWILVVHKYCKYQKHKKYGKCWKYKKHWEHRTFIDLLRRIC